jgi:ATP synthase F1 complex assembly factor 2
MTRIICRNQTSVAENSPKMNRFWKEATMGETETGYSVLLDKRPLKTPLGTVVSIPKDKRALALFTAAEWEAQDKMIKSYSLPLTSIVMRAIDSFSDTEIRQQTINQLLKYIHTDSICYQQDYPQSLQDLQSQHWMPIITWIQSKYNIKVNVTTGILAIKQSDDLVKKLKDILEHYDDFKLAAFEKACLRSKSFMIGLALIEGFISADEAAMAARVEVHHQIQKWGECEDSHDLEREDTKRQLASAAISLIKAPQCFSPTQSQL